MYKHKLQFDSQLCEAGMTVPANTTATAAAAVRAAGNLGRLAVTLVAADANVSIPDTKTLTIALLVGATATGSFAAPNPAPTMVYTMSGDFEPSLGDVVGSMIIPISEEMGHTGKKWVKPTIATNSTAATGTIDVFLEYLGN